MSGYTYDESGQYNFFILALLLIVLLPATLVAVKDIRGASNSVPPPVPAWNRKDASVTSVRRRSLGLKKRHVCIALGWCFLAYTAWNASKFKISAALYDPFKILGVAESSSEKDIKRHYRKLTLKFHPDKVKLAVNQTMESVEAYFVDITKAYKSLTDETIRRNYELYGHPDGKQEFGMGIAIPKSFIEAQNNVYVLGLYAVLFGVALPFSVGRWWFRSREFTKDAILNSTAAKFFLHSKEDASFERTVEVLSMSTEFERLLEKNANVVKSPEFDRLQNMVKKRLEELDCKMDGELFKRYKTCQRAGVLLYAHMLRVPISDPALLRLKQDLVVNAQRLVRALGNVILSTSWLHSYLHTLTLQQAIVQALHPSLPPTLQLPHLRSTSTESFGIADVAQADEGRLEKLLPGLDPKQRIEVQQVAQRWPALELVSADFKVIGERIITPGSIVQVTVKVKITPPSQKALPALNGHLAVLEGKEDGQAATPTNVMAEEEDMDTLLGRRSAEADGARPSPDAHAPLISNNRKPTCIMFVGDQKLDRVFMQPQYFNDLDVSGSTVRTLRMAHQAPGNPGLYTFQLFVRSDAYVGTDLRKDMKMRVEAPTAEAAAAAGDEEDDISDPEEDTLAGQMAAMRGQRVKRVFDDSEGEEEDDTSGSEEDAAADSDDGGTTSESDSES